MTTQLIRRLIVAGLLAIGLAGPALSQEQVDVGKLDKKAVAAALQSQKLGRPKGKLWLES